MHVLSAGNPEAASMVAEAKFRRGFAWRRVSGTAWTVVVRKDGRQLFYKNGAPAHCSKLSKVGIVTEAATF